MTSLYVCEADLNPSSFVESMEGLTSDIMVMNEREKGVASLGLASVEVAQGDPFQRVTLSKPFAELREELNRMKASMSGVDREDLIPCDLIQEETSTLTASALNLLQSRWFDIVEMEGSEEAVVDRFKYIPDSRFLSRARNLVSKLDALPMAGSVHSHGVGGGMADSKVYTPIGGRSGSGGRGGRGGRGQNPVALNPELNVVSVVDNAAPDKSWASISDLSRSIFLQQEIGMVGEEQSWIVELVPPHLPRAPLSPSKLDVASGILDFDKLWKSPPNRDYVPCVEPSSNYTTSGGSQGYLLVHTNGGLNQIICDMVAVARIINATLVIPKLDKQSFCFSDVFDQDHFISSLANDVKVIRKLPKELANATRAVNLCERDTEMPRKLMRILKKLREEDPAYYQLCHHVRHSEQPREGFFLLTNLVEDQVGGMNCYVDWIMQIHRQVQQNA
ncbi:unnamed protein product [Camellia sinensis]